MQVSRSLEKVSMEMKTWHWRQLFVSGICQFNLAAYKSIMEAADTKRDLKIQDKSNEYKAVAERLNSTLGNLRDLGLKTGE